jgi:hypothetical protein
VLTKQTTGTKREPREGNRWMTAEQEDICWVTAADHAKEIKLTGRPEAFQPSRADGRETGAGLMTNDGKAENGS